MFLLIEKPDGTNEVLELSPRAAIASNANTFDTKKEADDQNSGKLREKGLYKEPSFEEKIAIIVTELAEKIEELEARVSVFEGKKGKDTT
jgi:hypothetical protein